VEPPSDWEEIYRLVKEMRLTGPAANAAVDTMGCERLAGKDASVKDKRFHTLVALMLSSQTKDTVTAEAMARLMREMPAAEEGKEPGLNLENMLAIAPEKLNELIGKVGFHNNKTKYVLLTAGYTFSTYSRQYTDTAAQILETDRPNPPAKLRRRHTAHHLRPGVSAGRRPQDGAPVHVRHGRVEPRRGDRRGRARAPHHEPVGVAEPPV
jgi:endonuclease-3